MYLNPPFALTGEREAIPATTQPDGELSLSEGYGEDYSKPQATDPGARAIKRKQFNELMYRITSEIRQYQTQGIPLFIPASENNATPFPYDKGAVVRYDNGSSVDVYESLADTNVELPTNTTWWAKVSGVQAKGFYWGGLAGGTANALTLTGAAKADAYFAGMVISCTINTTNTSGSVTVDYNGMGAKTVKKSNGQSLVALAEGDLPLGTLQNFAYNGTDLVLMAPRPYSYGGQVASASTVDLTGVPGDHIEITGNATINQFLIARGRQMTIWFSGTPTIVDSANIINISNANIVVTVDDTTTIRGEASGVTRMITYARASGVALVASGGSDVQIFTASGTWNKPAGFPATSRVFIRGWGGGASGSGSGSGYNSGGGGGSYWERWLYLSDMGATETVTVGAGGVGILATQGQNGGNSSVGTLWIAYGGTAGTTGNTNVGGAGGTPLGQSPLGTRQIPAAAAFVFGTQGDGGTNGSPGAQGGLYNGGGAGTGSAGGSFGGGGAMMGGGGGAGGGATSNGAGGISKNAGNGGTGQATVLATADGGVPAGGGGGYYTTGQRPGHGGRGQVEITVFR